MVATRTKNRKMMMNEKRARRVSEVSQENGDIKLRLSEADRWDGIEKDPSTKPPNKRIVKDVWGDGEFMGSFGARVEM
jgi:hypothetical protein